MAILKGFPPSNTISPSVRIAERDLSFYGNTTPSSNVAAFVGFASKGPINLPTLIQNQGQLNTIFGFPHPDESDPYMIYAAQQFLRTASACYLLRVADTSVVSDTAALTASVDLVAAGEVVMVSLDNGATWKAAATTLGGTGYTLSGVTLLEKDIGERRPAYREYVARTNAFFPGPPKRSAS